MEQCSRSVGGLATGTMTSTNINLMAPSVLAVKISRLLVVSALSSTQRKMMSLARMAFLTSLMVSSRSRDTKEQ